MQNGGGGGVCLINVRLSANAVLSIYQVPVHGSQYQCVQNEEIRLTNGYVFCVYLGYICIPGTSVLRYRVPGIRENVCVLSV